MDLNVSLLREKFIISDALPQDISDRDPVIALSNRLTLPLHSDDGQTSENLVVRAQNMHTCVRLGSVLARKFYESGPLMGRFRPFDFKGALESVISPYEQKWNPQRWVSVYHKGKVVFEEGPGSRHAFLDIIEQCDSRNKGDYEKAMNVAQDAFRQAGRLVHIKHDSNIALIVTVSGGEAKCGIIVRGPNRATTFNIIVRSKDVPEMTLAECLGASSAFLEGIQLSFFAGMTQQKANYEMISRTSDEALQAAEARRRLGQLNMVINKFEHEFEIGYRPERPNFEAMALDAEKYAEKMFSSGSGLKPRRKK